MLNIGVSRVVTGDLKEMVSIVKSRDFDSCRILCSVKEQNKSNERSDTVGCTGSLLRKKVKCRK